MSKKRKQSQPEQLLLFDLNQSTENPEDNNIDVEIDDYEDVDLDDIDFEELGFTDEVSDRTLETDSELLTLKLLRQAIAAQHSDDVVMADFAEYVLPNLLRSPIQRC